MTTAKDTTGVMTILDNVYGKTEDLDIREDLLLEHIKKMSDAGYVEQAKLLSSMHISEQEGGVSDRFNQLNILTNITDTDTTKSEVAIPKTYSEERMQTKAEETHNAMRLKLATHIEEYNDYVMRENEYYEDIESKKEARLDINKELSEYEDIYEATGEYWSKWNPIGMLIGGKTARRQASISNPELVAEKRKLDAEIYEMNYGKGALHRNHQFYNLKSLHEDKLIDALASLNLLEGDVKTSVVQNVDGTYKNILDDEEIPEYVDPEFDTPMEPTITTRVPGRGY